jgi:pimeloyl-ACP methyl ester carboxylesterase
MDSKNRQTLLFIHGLRGDHHGLRFIEDELKKDYKTINTSLPGYGGSPELSSHNLDSYIEYLHKYVSSLSVKPVLIAHSMGSIIASRYADKYPDDCDSKMVLMSPILRGNLKKIIEKSKYYAFKGVTAPLSHKAKHNLLASKTVSYIISHTLTYDKTKQKFIDEEHYKYSGRFASANSLLGDIKISATSTTLVPKSKQTLILIGSRDQLTPPKRAKDLATATAAEYREIPDTGHLLIYERPKETAKIIRDFLQSPSPLV